MQMFQWASSGHERTLNQRIRPGLIIVINKLPPDSDVRWLGVDFATERLLSHYQLSGAFDDLRNKWATRGKKIETAKDLILCYYDSFRVVCIPNFVQGKSDLKSTTLVAQQLGVLYKEIWHSTRRLRKKRLDFGMNLNVTSFNTYVEHAFNRLTKDLKAPIDFYYLASRDPPVPSRFSEHLTSVIVKMLAKDDYEYSNERGQELDLLNRLIPYLSCCIALKVPTFSQLSGE
jgi:hypothetical protein